MLAPWWLLFLLMDSAAGAGGAWPEGPSVRQRSSSSSSPVRRSPMDFQWLHVRRSWIRRTVSCGISKGWGLFIGWEGVLFLCFLCLVLHGANAAVVADAAAGGLGASGDGGEDEQESPAVDLVVISFISRGLFVILGCNILLC
ncbi:hypothetical protein PVAP13_1NG190500 [Panicum virgatum]|uniref:Secreted protein n=1 Tax=Panicum virgatum TaxID=38727 RepID=A0A8T0WUU9_PANVG|nr:hypothetical protein PVAP13_1NG190500 [Panicum virgatum]